MSRRINIIIDDDTWHLLEKVPQGDRSRTINLALREWAHHRRRRNAVDEMDQLQRASGSRPITAAEIAGWVREDRDGKH